MELHSLIEELEEWWLPALEENAASVFHGIHLPSHDEHHHRRVWRIARKLLPELTANRLSFDSNKLEAMLVAVYFHDLGMASHPGPDHGAAGRRLCETWFRDHNMGIKGKTTGDGDPLIFPGFEEMLEAIERHDDKEGAGSKDRDPASLLALLGLCDDMDALGVTGIYRYAEIYLLRGRSLGELGTAILRNAGARYRKMESYFPFLPSLGERIREEYLILTSFWSHYNQQLCSVANPGFTDRGHLGIINIIRGPGLEGRMEPGDLHRVSGGRECSVAHCYFLELKKQLEHEPFS